MKRKRGEKSPDGEIWGMTQKVGAADYKDPTWRCFPVLGLFARLFSLASLLTRELVTVTEGVEGVECVWKLFGIFYGSVG
jgi:hypothetical protein